ncbi:MAG: hypothetical protein WDN06_16305 [Asticcacaulis sp.]
MAAQPKSTHTDRAFEGHAKAGTEDAASQSQLPGAGHDERGRYGKSVPDPDSRDGGPKTQPRKGASS